MYLNSTVKENFFGAVIASNFFSLKTL